MTAPSASGAADAEELKFQADLLTATALSLETKAIEDYRRGLRGQLVQPPPQHERRQAPTNTPVTRARRRNSEIAISLEPPTHIGRERSRTPQRTAAESDLISFASPTNRAAEEANFEQLLQKLQNLEATPTQSVVPFGAQPAPPQPQPVMSHYMAAPANALVPYQSPPAQTRQPLTSEHLQQLYNMPTQHALVRAQPATAMGYAAHPMQYYNSNNQRPFLSTVAGPYMPVVPGAAAYMPPQGYGYGYAPPPGPPQPQPQPQPPMSYGFRQPAVATAAATAAAGSSTSHSTPTHSMTKQPAANLTPQRPVRAASVASSLQSSDLIDLIDADDSRVSVLEAFDPLHIETDVPRK